MLEKSKQVQKYGAEYLHKKMVEKAAPAAGVLQEEIYLLLHRFPFLVGKNVFGFKGLIHWQEYWVEILRVGSGRSHVDGYGRRLPTALFFSGAAPDG